MKIIDILENIEYIELHGERLPVLRNPSIQELVEKNNQYSLRGLVDHEGNTYWWRGRAAIHFQIARHIGLEGADSMHNHRGISRLEINRASKLIYVISGWQTAIESSSFRKLTSTGIIKIKYGSNGYTFNEYLDIVRQYGSFLS